MNDIDRLVSLLAHVKDTDSGHTSLHVNTPSSGPAHRTETDDLFTNMGQDLGLSPLRPSITMVGPIQNARLEYKEKLFYPVS